MLSHLVKLDVLVRLTTHFLLEGYVLTFKVIHHNKEFEFTVLHYEYGPFGVPSKLTAHNWGVGRHECGLNQVLEDVLVVHEPIVGLHDDLFILVVHHGDTEVLVESLPLGLFVLVGALLGVIVIE